MHDQLEIFGVLIREERKLRGLSQEYFSEIAGISRSYLGEIERGEANLSFMIIDNISKALGLTISELIIKYEEKRQCS